MDPLAPRYQEGTCETFYVNADVVAAIAAQMPTKDAITAMAETFKLLGDPTRLRAIYALSRGELCVCDLASMLDMSNTAISNHLRVLRNVGLVSYRREGKLAYYSIADEHITRLLAECLDHVKEPEALGASG